MTWTSGGSSSLGGTQGPNNGWLVVIVGAFALGWIRAMVRGSWIGVVGVLLVSIVMLSTAVGNWLDNRDVLEGRAGWGLLLVVAAAVVLAVSAVVRGLHLARDRSEEPTASR